MERVGGGGSHTWRDGENACTAHSDAGKRTIEPAWFFFLFDVHEANS